MEKVKQFKIYQIKDIKNTDYAFRSWENASEKFSFTDYKYVYQGSSNSLDEIYMRFNINRPSDYNGHSLSASGIVLFGNQYYYCDSFGWKDITEVIKNEN